MHSLASALRMNAAWRIVPALVLVAILTACSADNRGVLHTAKGDVAFTIEIADTEADRAKGLMYRTSLAPDAGMLFVYQSEQQVSFWMQNTLVPLDMLFIGADGVVKTIHANAQPMDTTSIPSQVPVQYVLEIAGGRAAEIGAAPGDKFDNPRIGKSP